MTDRTEVSFEEIPITGTELFYGFGPTVDLDISTGGWVDIPIDIVRRADAPFSHSLGTAAVEFTERVNLEIHYHITTDISTGTSRSNSAARLAIDTGVRYKLMRNSFTGMYNRQVTQGISNASVDLYRRVIVGNKIKVQAKRIAGTSTVIVPANAMGLKLKVV